MVIEDMRSQIPRYHTRAMRSAMFEKFTGDQAAASSTDQAVVDERIKQIKQIIDTEDPNVLQDLRALNRQWTSDEVQHFLV